jgi:alanyl-tRNA synthetase
VWRLYDTYGFPVDLTRLMAAELGLTVNEQEFEQAQTESRAASKAGAKKDTATLVKLDVHDIAALEKNPDVPKTDDSAKFSEFLPYTIWSDVIYECHPQLDLGNITATLKAIFHDKSFVDSTTCIPSDTTFGVILDKTSFYAEAGGQEYDTGSIVIDDVAHFEVENVQVYNGYVLHTGSLKYGQLKLGDEVVSSYDEVSIQPSTVKVVCLTCFFCSFDDGPCGIITL